VFGLSGIVDQRDFEAPYFDSYRISPRYGSDISEPVNAEFTVTSPWNLLDGPIELENTSTGAAGHYWTFGNGDASEESTPEYTYEESGVFSIQLTTFSTNGNCSDQTTVEIDVLLVSVDEMDWTGSVYPNPTHGPVIFESSEAIESIQVFRISGALVQSETPNSMRWMMDTADWAEGIYVVRIQTATGTKSLKLVRGE
jgi:PKD repeat protein